MIKPLQDRVVIKNERKRGDNKKWNNISRS